MKNELQRLLDDMRNYREQHQWSGLSDYDAGKQAATTHWIEHIEALIARGAA